MENKTFITLVNKYLSNKATPEEEKRLLAYYDKLQESGTEWNELLMGSEDAMGAELYGRVLSAIKKREAAPAKVVYFKRWYVAASVIFSLAAVSLLFFYYTHKLTKPVNNRSPTANNNIISPGGNKALLTLSDGSTITLDDAAAGELAKQAGVSISKTANGELIYTIEGSSLNSTKADELLYNTIQTPKGGQYQVVLPDGSKVWLNAESSLRYPTSFNGNVRSVELTGEAYFEVTKNKHLPFKVVSNDHVVEVLGTHFNISAYPDETTVKTTLLEGSVKVLSGRSKQSRLLKPGEQSKVGYADNEISIQQVNTEEAVAWKNGYFFFNDEDLKSIMNKFARWYNVEVEYKGNVDDLRFGGRVSRSKGLEQALKVIDQTGSVKIKIEGRRVIVMP